MTKIDIISGFLGAGKTTLIKKLIKEGFKGEKLVLIENEFGEIGIDGGFLKDAGVQITEMNSGCICCSLVGDFGTALKKVITEYAPDRIIIEPSGVGKLSDVIKAVKDVAEEVEVQLYSYTDDCEVDLYSGNLTVINEKGEESPIVSVKLGSKFNDRRVTALIVPDLPTEMVIEVSKLQSVALLQLKDFKNNIVKLRGLK